MLLPPLDVLGEPLVSEKIPDGPVPVPEIVVGKHCVDLIMTLPAQKRDVFAVGLQVLSVFRRMALHARHKMMLFDLAAESAYLAFAVVHRNARQIPNTVSNTAKSATSGFILTHSKNLKTKSIFKIYRFPDIFRTRTRQHGQQEIPADGLRRSA